RWSQVSPTCLKLWCFRNVLFLKLRDWWRFVSSCCEIAHCSIHQVILALIRPRVTVVERNVLAMLPDPAQPDLSEVKAKKLGISLEDYLLPTHGRIQMISEDGNLLPEAEQGSTPGHEYPM